MPKTAIIIVTQNYSDSNLYIFASLTLRSRLVGGRRTGPNPLRTGRAPLQTRLALEFNPVAVITQRSRITSIQKLKLPKTHRIQR